MQPIELDVPGAAKRHAEENQPQPAKLSVSSLPHLVQAREQLTFKIEDTRQALARRNANLRELRRKATATITELTDLTAMQATGEYLGGIRDAIREKRVLVERLERAWESENEQVRAQERILARFEGLLEDFDRGNGETIARLKKLEKQVGSRF
jgi:predicted RNase H-like nuclease (RuvC/YqgF family)